jgi:hypothetical protein
LPYRLAARLARQRASDWLGLALIVLVLRAPAWLRALALAVQQVV